MGVAEKEVRNYISLKDEQVEELLHPKVHLRQGLEIRKYTNIIFKMLRDGRDVNTIFWYVKYKGFSGKDAALLSAIYYVHDKDFAALFNFSYEHAQIAFDVHHIFLHDMQKSSAENNYADNLQYIASAKRINRKIQDYKLTADNEFQSMILLLQSLNIISRLT